MRFKPILVAAGLVLMVIGIQPFVMMSLRSEKAGGVARKPRRTAEPVRDDAGGQKIVDEKDKKPAKNAHIVVIGNEKYLEGAMVMGWSLRKYKNSHTDLICLTNEGKVSQGSLDRLRSAGWDRVMEVDGMTEKVKKSNWKDSFAKLHIFNFTEYGKIAYWDSDMAVNGDANAVFGLKLPKNEGYPWVLAIGNPPKKGKKYFQTGMMVFRPTETLKRSLWRQFEKGIKTKKYNSLNARDGMVLRDFFDGNYSVLPKKFSRNIDPRIALDGIVGIHYRGGWKPWFNREQPMKKRTEGPLDDTRKDFGYAYLLWWRLYEEMHGVLSKDEDPAEYPPGTSPSTHVWMMRETPDSYTQLLSVERDKRLNITHPGVTFKTSKLGESCAQSCHPSPCHHPSLQTTLPNTCTYLTSHFACTSCTPGIYTKQRNGSVYPGYLPSTDKPGCRFNMRLDDRGMPTCEASDPEVQRVCPCLTG